MSNSRIVHTVEIVNIQPSKNEKYSLVFTTPYRNVDGVIALHDAMQPMLTSVVESLDLKPGDKITKLEITSD